MADVCKAHGLVVAADGRCVVCRRPPWETSEQTQQSAREQALTAILGLCLIGALARVVQLGLVESTERNEPQAVARASPQLEAERAANGADEAGSSEAMATVTPPRPTPEALAEARKRVRVVMYASPWCYICDHARDQLLAHDVQLVEHDIDADPTAARRLAKRNPSATVPTFEIGDETVVGYNPWQLQDAVDALAARTLATN